MTRLRGLTGGTLPRFLLVLAIGWFYLWTAVPEWRAGMVGPSGGGYYNLLTRGFQKGTLALDLPADPFLAQIKNPSDPDQRGDHGLHDASYYRGRYYLYFGAAPVALIFLPFHLLTGRYIDESLVPPLFAFAGLLASLWLMMAVRRRHFPLAPPWVALGCIAALGFANLMPVLLRRSNVWEVPITCAYACFMAGLCGLFQSLHARRPAAWLAFASVAFGLAVASRPTYLFGCGALLVPILAQAWRGPRGGPVPAETSAGRLAVAGILPLAAIGAVLALYNIGRFGSPLDFGFRHLMNGEQVWKEDLFSPRFLWYNFRVYALAPARWGPYFPFVSVARLPPPPAGHLGAEDPFGVIPNIPFALLGAVSLVLSLRSAPWERRLRLLCIAIAVGVAGTGLATCSFGGAINRYEVDFLPGVIVLACIAWLWIAGGGVRGPGRVAAATLVVAALAYSIAFNALASLRHNELFAAEHPGMYRRIAHRWDWLPQKIDEWLGTRYGPLELQVVFPEDKVGRTEPLVVTGSSFLSDYVNVRYEGPGLVRFGLQHSAYGNFTGPALPARPGSIHTVRVEMGSLYPPPAHPFFDSLGAAEAELCQKTLRVTLDGATALQRDIPFFDAASREPSIGTSGDRDEYREPFSGRIVSWRRLPIDLLAPERGPVRLAVEFPAFTGIRSEPLLSTGTQGHGDLVYVRYEDPGSVSFGVDHWGNGSKRSSPIRVDYAAGHAIEIESASLEGPRGAVGTEQVGPFALRLDGRTIFSEQSPYASCALETVTAGINRLGSSAATGMFRGQMMEERGLSGGARAMESYGTIVLDFRMPSGAAHPQPLVTTGRPGHGDALWIRWAGPGVVRLGYDHWGSGLVESGDIPMAADSEHLMAIDMPSLLAPAANPVEERCRRGAVVELDGRLAWAQRVLFHPAPASEAYVGSNGVESSSCDHDFTGGISWFERHAQAPVSAQGEGPVSMKLVLPAGRAGFREPLVAVGRTGRADILLIRYVDGGHVAFGLDHWGVSYSESPPVEVDYARLHVLQVAMPGLELAAEGSVLQGEAVVRLDGAVAWRERQEFYGTRAPPAVGVNPIGASTCEPEFSGILVGISRP